MTVAPGLLRTGSQVKAVIKGETHREEYNLPTTSISAQRAAKQIVFATKRGSAELIVTVQAQILAHIHGAFPGITSDLLAFANRFLPDGSKVGTARYEGKGSETPISQSFLITLGQKAKQNHNEESG